MWSWIKDFEKKGVEGFKVASGRGEFTLLMPKVNVECMDEYLIQMSEHLGERHAYFIMDNAGWHISKELEVPENIEIIYLPPYSPELKPVERLWQYIKDDIIKNRIYETIKALEDRVCKKY